MRPLKLRLQNFTSFRAPTELNFGALELYAIEGPTGSGKSSLLDAITFALYGEVPRLGGKGLDALISTGENRLSVELEFELGGQIYRVARTKGRKQAQNEVRFVRLEGTQEITVAQENKKKDLQAAISGVLGLSLESFKRAILLPQGEFDRFLKGTGKERQELLGSLVGLERFQKMGQWAGERSRMLEAERKSLNSRLEGEYAGATLEAREALEARLGTVQAEHGTLEQRAQALQQTLLEWGALEALHQRQTRHTLERHALERERPDIEASAQRVAEARRVAGVLPLLERLEGAEAQAQQGQAQLEGAAQTLRTAADRAHEAQATLVGAQSAAMEIPELEARLSALERAETLEARLSGLGGSLHLSHPAPLPFSEAALDAARTLEQTLRTLEAARQRCEGRGRELGALEGRIQASRVRLDALEQERGILETRRDAAQQQAGALEGRFEALSAGQNLAQRLAALKVRQEVLHPQPLPWDEERFEATRGLVRQVQELRQEHGALLELRHSLAQREATLESVRGELAGIRAEEQGIVERWNRLFVLESELGGPLEQARVRDRASGLRAGLRTGGACPVCEQAVVTLPPPRPSELGALEARDAALKGEKAALEAQQKALENRYRTLEATLKADERGLNAEQSRLAQREQALEALRLELGDGDPNEILSALTAGLAAQVRTLTGGEDFGRLLARIRSELGAARSARDAASAGLADLEAERGRQLGTFESDTQTLREGREALASEQADLERQRQELGEIDPAQDVLRLLSGLAAQVREITGDESVAVLRSRVQGRVRSLRAALEVARQEQAGAGTALGVATSQLEAAQLRHEEREGVRAALEAELGAALALLGVDRPSLRSRALSGPALQQLEQQVQDWRDAVALLERSGAQLEREWAGRRYDPQQHAGDRQEASVLSARLSALSSERGALEQQLRTLEERRLRRRELEKQLAEIGRRYDGYATLASSLRSDAFPAYLLEEVEDELLERASTLLYEISDGRYRLTLEGGEYAVADGWNSDETRGVRTLSGGETFLASLALAISLSDYLAGNRKLGALFLDEGFGTLDPAALEAVAGALERLQTTGRMVGVITHVPSLAERLPARVRVFKSTGGSRLEVDG